MRKLSKYKDQASVLIILSLLITLWLLRLGLSSVLGDKEDAASIERSLSLDPGNAEAAYRLGRLYQLLMIGDERRAEDLYMDSIRHSPLLSASWLGLTETYIEADEEEKARLTLDRAVELIPSSIGLLWESSLLAFSLGERGLAMDNLRIVAKADPGRRQRVFDISRQMIGDPGLILNNVVSDEILGDYLRYLISKDVQDETYPVWRRMRMKGKIPEATALAYVDYLLRKEDAEEAKRIWAGLYPEGGNDSLLWNGSFETDSVGSGLDWRIGEPPEGAEIDFDYGNKTRGERSLKITFSGKLNVDFHHLSQTVPVVPDTNYLLTADISTRDVTTRDGVRLHVRCKGMNEFSDTYTGTVDWTTARVSFVTPHDCKVMDVSLIRSKSRRLDNLISGEAWIDNVNLFKLGRSTDA